MRPALRAADRIDQQIEIGQTQTFKKSNRQQYNLGIHRRANRTDSFDAELMKLAEPPSLRPVIPEHRSDIKQFGRLGIGIQLLFEIGPHHSGGVFRPQGYAAPAPVGKSIHFFLHYIGGFADAAQK